MSMRGRPLSLWILVLLLGQLSARALVGGSALLMDPSGALVGVPAEPLAATPFDSFAVPGLVLLSAFGVLPAAVCYGLYSRRPWARPAALGVGLALLVWISVELIVGFSRPTVALNLVTAIGTAGLAAHPAVRRDLRSAAA